MKKILGLFIFLFFLSYYSSFSQNDNMFKEKRERKRVWRRWGSHKEAYNPYLKKKGKDKPSSQVNKANKREERRQKRNFKKQLKRSKKKLNN
ncbi:MAG: hypothetical protein Q7W45_16800 [Bacteroidota bacterium]|nr:hypothetical protein [Bacteroidota bacterium]